MNLKLLLLLVIQSSWPLDTLGHEGHSHEMEGVLVDTYHELMHRFNIESPEHFTVSHLSHMVMHFTERFPCMGTNSTLVCTL